MGMIFDLIDRIYETVLNPDLWPAVLAEITTAFGAVSTTVVPLENRAAVLISPGGEEAQLAYAQHWWKHDSIAQAVLRSKRYGVFRDWVLLPDDLRSRDPFYQEFRRPFDMNHNLAFATNLDHGKAFGISLQLPSSAPGPPDDEAVVRFAAIGQHVCRAMMLCNRSAAMDARGDALTKLMTTSPFGVALLDGSGRVLVANTALEALHADGLRIADRLLRAANREDQVALDKLIRRALSDPSFFASVVGIRRPSGGHPLLFSVIAVTERHRILHLSEESRLCRAIATVVDPQASVPMRVEPILRRLALSPAEARLACVVGRGLSPKEAAGQLGLTEGTVRTRLKMIYEKLCVSRQSELTRLVTQLSLVNGSTLDP